MAQINDDDGKSSINVELNLVPFIDLMCVCITFLLITAVWTQVSMIQLGATVYGQNTDQENGKKMEPDFVAFRLDIKDSGYVLVDGLDVVNVPKIGDQYDGENLLVEIKKIKEKYPAKTDAVVSIADNLAYKLLVTGMDQLIAAGFTDIGIATGEVR